MKTSIPNAIVLFPRVNRNEPYTTSDIIAAGTGIAHRRIREAVRKYEKGLSAFGKVVAYQTTLESGQAAAGYMLNEQHSTFLLTLLKNTPAVVEFKKELVRQFYDMRTMLLERSSPIWQDTRALAKEIRKQETESIKALVDYAAQQGSKNSERYYTNLSRLADDTAGIDERDKAQTVQLTSLMLIEKIIAREIQSGIQAQMPYKAIYQTIKGKLAAFRAVTSTEGVLA